MGKYTKMSQQVLEKVGGLSNITFVERCATRLRIHYASKSKVDVEAIKGIENVVGVVAKTGQVQIIMDRKSTMHSTIFWRSPAGGLPMTVLRS